MGSTPLPSSFTLLSPLSLRAFSPSPDTGTLFGPLTAADPMNPSSLSRLIADREAAEDLELCSLLMGIDAEDLVRSSQHKGLQPPFRLPAQHMSVKKETPWFLEFHHATVGGNRIKQLSFSTQNPRRSVFMDFSDAALSLYGFRIECEEADLSQTISVDTHDYRIGTEQFTFRILAKDFKNALLMGLRLSAAIYFCGQYRPEELGSLQFRPSPKSDWTSLPPIGPKRKQFSLPRTLPDDGALVSFASQKKLEPNAAGAALPVFGIDLLPADPTRWNVGLVLRRPHGRRARLMPLHPRLQRDLWDPAFAWILKRSVR